MVSGGSGRGICTRKDSRGWLERRSTANQRDRPGCPSRCSRILPAIASSTTVSGSRSPPRLAFTPTSPAYRGGHVGHDSRCASTADRVPASSSPSRSAETCCRARQHRRAARGVPGEVRRCGRSRGRTVRGEEAPRAPAGHPRGQRPRRVTSAGSRAIEPDFWGLPKQFPEAQAPAHRGHCATSWVIAPLRADR